MAGRPESWARTEKSSMRGIHQTPVLDGRLMRFLLLPLLLLPLTAPALAEMKFVLQYQDQFGKWHRYQEKHNEGGRNIKAAAAAAARAKSSNCWFGPIKAPLASNSRSVTAVPDSRASKPAGEP